MIKKSNYILCKKKILAEVREKIGNRHEINSVQKEIEELIEKKRQEKTNREIKCKNVLR